MAFKQKASGIPFESHVSFSSIRSVARACLCFFKGAACQSDGTNHQPDTLKQTFNQI
ncbi:hypothetical protein [Bacillus atrophaeus]|uniref:hypothetical protein n=1 Tax=Bacillus atrophaeus TaxID=1452 RepID=UPI00399D122A